MYKLILMDLDDTLFDYEVSEKNALKNTFASFNFFEEYDEEKYSKIKHDYSIINKKMWNDLELGLIEKSVLPVKRFEKTLQANNLLYDPKEISDEYIRQLGYKAYMFNGVEKLCKDIYENYKIRIITNGIAKVQFSRIKASPIEKYIDKIIVSEEVGYEKPNKEIFNIAIDGFSNDEVLMVGDSLIADIKGANDSGIDSCWINVRNRKNNTEIVPKYEIFDIRELRKILFN